MKKKIKIISISGVLVLLLLTFISPSVYNMNLPQVTAVKPERTLLPLTYDVVASIDYENAIAVKAESNWKITHTHIENGDWVNRGDLLVTLDTSDYELRVMQQELEQLRLQNAINNLRESVKEPKTAELTAPFDGHFVSLEPINIGQRLEKGATIGRFVNDSMFIVTVPFVSAYRSDIKAGLTVDTKHRLNDRQNPISACDAFDHIMGK